MNNMTIYGTNPFDLFEQVFGNDGILNPETRTPAIDVRETKDSYFIEAELPGIDEKNLALEVKNRTLTLSTIESGSVKEKAEAISADTGRFIMKERRDFRFARSFDLPEDIDLEKIEATYKDGLLRIALPRTPESAPRIVQVKAA